MSLNEFELGKELGKGAFSSVHVVKRKIDNKTYAMKRVKISQLNTKDRENALNEIRLLASLSHVNIIGYKEAFYDEISQTINIVMEFADDGDVLSKINFYTSSKLYFNERTIWSIVIQLLQGLKYLHDNNIMHRDLKSANVFLMKSGIVKIGDLNVSKIAKMGMASTQTGTPFYASLEVWKDKPYDYKSDVWSIGCIIYEMCTLKTPFRGNSLPAVFVNIQKGTYDPIPYIYSKDLGKIISYMLQVNPSNRLTCEQLLKTDIITEKIKNSNNNNSGCNGSACLLEEKADMMKTIKIPKNLREINRALPKKQYDNEFNTELKYNNHKNINKSTREDMKINISSGHHHSNNSKQVISILNSVIGKQQQHHHVNRNNNKHIKNIHNSDDKILYTENNKREIHIIHCYKEKANKAAKSKDKDKDKENPIRIINKSQLENENHYKGIVYCKPLITSPNTNNKVLQYPNQPPGNKSSINKKSVDHSPNRNKTINIHLTPSSYKQCIATPIRLSKKPNPSTSTSTSASASIPNKNNSKLIPRPISKDNNQRQVTPILSNKKIHHYPNQHQHPLSAIPKSTTPNKNQPKRVIPAFK